MAKPGEYSDIFRAIGRLLDQQGAQDLEIVDEGSFMRASWQAAGENSRERRTYRAFQLDRLRLEARLLRSEKGAGVPKAGLSETLRLVGADLDRTGTEFMSLLQTEEGFQVSTMVGGRHVTRTYRDADIAALA